MVLGGGAGIFGNDLRPSLDVGFRVGRKLGGRGATFA